MKSLIRIISLLILVLVSVSVLGSCLYLASGESETNKYLTRSDVENMISGLEQNVTVNGGDNLDITINNTGNANLAAAAKGLLSAVSVHCNFTVVTTSSPSIWGPGSTQTYDASSAGSGVIYQLDKEAGSAYIITNYHVVYCKNADTADDISDDITVYLYGQEQEQYAIRASYIGGSKNYDIAVLEVKGSNVLRVSNAVAATFADSNDVSILDTAIAIGNPENFGLSATVGAVNVESETITMTSVDGTGYIALRVIRTDAAVNGGNSGGGLFNDKGEIIGIVNAKMSDSDIDNIGYAIPSNVAKYVADNIIYYDKLDPNNNSVYRALIGVNLGVKSAGTVYDTETGKVSRYEEVMVESVVSGSLSDGKLKSGDVITSATIDGVDYEIVRTFNVIDVMLTARRGSSVVFNVVRDGNEISVTIDMVSAELTAY